MKAQVPKALDWGVMNPSLGCSIVALSLNLFALSQSLTPCSQQEAS
jgi:hypothetical protein